MNSVLFTAARYRPGIYEVPGIVRIASFRDPFGNPLQIAQPLVG